jgi:hypothetical protein
MKQLKISFNNIDLSKTFVAYTIIEKSIKPVVILWRGKKNLIRKSISIKHRPVGMVICTEKDLKKNIKKIIKDGFLIRQMDASFDDITDVVTYNGMELEKWTQVILTDKRDCPLSKSDDYLRA